MSSTFYDTECFSTECCKIKTKVITTANQNQLKVNITRSQCELKINTASMCKRPQAWENVSDQVGIGFSFESDWLREWH